MVAYNFQKRFVEPIQRGDKTHTMRAVGKRRHAVVGDRLQIYFGQRTQHVRKIIPDQVCTRVERVRMNLGFRSVILGPDGSPIIEGQVALDAFAVSDGFKNWEDLDAFWKFYHPETRFFDGLLIGWGAIANPA